MAMASIILIDTWWQTAFVFIVMSAGLQALPQEPQEAAEVDGASTSSDSVTSPCRCSARSSSSSCCSGRSTASRSSRSSSGPRVADPLTTTESVQILAYRTAFKQLNMSQSMAMMVIFAVIVLAVVLVYQRLGRRRSRTSDRHRPPRLPPAPAPTRRPGGVRDRHRGDRRDPVPAVLAVRHLDQDAAGRLQVAARPGLRPGLQQVPLDLELGGLWPRVREQRRRRGRRGGAEPVDRHAGRLRHRSLPGPRRTAGSSCGCCWPTPPRVPLRDPDVRPVPVRRPLRHPDRARPDLPGLLRAVRGVARPVVLHGSPARPRRRRPGRRLLRPPVPPQDLSSAGGPRPGRRPRSWSGSICGTR